MSSKDGSEAGVEHLAQFPEHNKFSFFLLSHNSGRYSWAFAWFKQPRNAETDLRKSFSTLIAHHYFRFLFLSQKSCQWLGLVSSISNYTIPTCCTSKMQKTILIHYLLQSACLLVFTFSWRTSICLMPCCLRSPLDPSAQIKFSSFTLKLIFVPVSSSPSLLPKSCLGPSSSLSCEWSDGCLALLKIQWKSRTRTRKGRQTGHVRAETGNLQRSQTQKSDLGNQ